MNGRVMRFIARRTQLRLRNARAVSQFVNRYGHLIQPTASQRNDLVLAQREQARADAEWSRRHGPVEGGATVIPFGAPTSD